MRLVIFLALPLLAACAATTVSPETRGAVTSFNGDFVVITGPAGSDFQPTKGIREQANEVCKGPATYQTVANPGLIGPLGEIQTIEYKFLCA